MPIRLLIDMDGPLADFETHWLREWYMRATPIPEYFSAREFFASHEWELSDRIERLYRRALSHNELNLARNLYQRSGFFAELSPVRGALRNMQILRVLDQNGLLECHICTTPSNKNATCASDKIQWVGKHLGAWWQDRLILTQDKSLISADYLLDDHPQPKNKKRASWDHIQWISPNQEILPNQYKLTVIGWDLRALFRHLDADERNVAQILPNWAETNLVK
jgi:5'(3')-deoxyribonucleotidase